MAPRKLVSQIWESEKGLSAMLVFLCLAMFVGGPLLAMGVIGGFVFDSLFSLLLISGAVTVARKPVVTAVVSILTLTTLVLRWWSRDAPESVTRMWGVGFTILLLLILAVLVLVQVFREGPITSHRAQGAIVVYLLLGLAWAEAYELICYLSPGALNIPQATGARLTNGLVYFSFITLTTTGYGDITPVHPIARTLVVAEALTGQLYLAILIARLVSMRMSTRRRD